MSIPKSNRRHYRAPLHSDILFLEGENVHRAVLGNISEKGLFIQQIPMVPETKEFHFILDVPLLRNCRVWSEPQILAANSLIEDRHILRTQGNLVRIVDGDDLGAVLGKGIGVELSNVSSDVRLKIRSYVETFTQNIVRLIKELENYSEKNAPMIRKLSLLMDYSQKLRIPDLKAQVNHDYQSLFQSS